MYSQKIEYEISLCGRDQKVKIFNKNNNIFRGWIEYEFFKKNSSKKIVKKQKITNSLANKLFVELTENGINEPIKVEKNCGDFYLDGDYLSFSIKKDGKTVNELVLAEVYPESESNVEKNQCRRKMQILVTDLDNDLNLKKRHAEIFKKLPNNTCYWSGIYMTCKKK